MASSAHAMGQVAFSPHLPSVLASSDMPEQELKFTELFTFKKWQVRLVVLENY